MQRSCGGGWGSSDMTALLSHWATAMAAMLLRTHCSPGTVTWNGAHPNHAPAFVLCLMSSWLLVGNSGDSCLLGGICFSSVGSPFSLSHLLRQETFYKSRIFYSVGNLFLLPLLLPPPDVLICSLQGHKQL